MVEEGRLASCRMMEDIVARSYSLQFRILYFVLYWRLIRLDFPAAMTLPP